MFNLATFSLKEMTECGAALRTFGNDASSLEEVATRIVQYLYQTLCDVESGRPACVLVRFFKTHPFQGLSPDLQRFAADRLGRPPGSAQMKCFTLMATAGDRPEWNHRGQSERFQAIPIDGDDYIVQFPMFSQLLSQFGIDLHALLKPGSNLLVDQHEKSFNVFYVREAAESPYVPGQKDFVVPLRVRSVLGFGGLLPSGELYAVILFSRVPVGRETADLFKTLALCSKIAVLPFDGRAVFETGG